jgi:hypothetical protein
LNWYCPALRAVQPCVQVVTLRPRPQGKPRSSGAPARKRAVTLRSGVTLNSASLDRNVDALAPRTGGSWQTGHQLYLCFVCICRGPYRCSSVRSPHRLLAAICLRPAGSWISNSVAHRHSSSEVPNVVAIAGGTREDVSASRAICRDRLAQGFRRIYNVCCCNSRLRPV